MLHLLYKEFRLSIHPLFFLILLCGTLLLIPQWVFFVAMMYILFIAVPNIFITGKAQNDLVFSVMLPVRKRDVVKSRILSIAILQILQILVAVPFAILNIKLYQAENFLLDPNFSFFGFVFAMYAVHNVVFFPLFYKTGYKIGIPSMAGIAAAVLFATTVEFSILFVPALKVLDGFGHLAPQLWLLSAGILFFVIINMVAYRISARRFTNIDL